MLVSTALVLLMTPALAFFYGGMVRSKNALNTMMMSFVVAGPGGVAWALVGYSLAFAPGGATHRLVRVCGPAGRRHGGARAPFPICCSWRSRARSPSSPRRSSPAPWSSACASAPISIFIVLGCRVYAPVAHWVWGGGFLATVGALDFAGGAVVHVNAASAALVAALVVGPRKDYGRHAILPHNVPFTLLGAGLLWFGWFGFNAGSALAPGPRSPGVRQHDAGAGGHAGGLDAARPHARWARDRGRRRHRDRRRAGRGHAGGGLRRAGVGARDWRDWRRARATSRSSSARGPSWTTRSTWSPRTASAAPPAPSSPACSPRRRGAAARTA